jgi:hypothetical protein
MAGERTIPPELGGSGRSVLSLGEASGPPH